MSKLNKTPRNPVDADTDLWYRQVASQVNALSEGSIVGTYNALTAAPTSGTYLQGDFIKNKTPTELGASASKYVVTGFICVASGTPGTFVQARVLTGN
ncbi:MAG: hypothetical protein HQ446_00590 [Polaromonas sp.]|nr:hypothetical protein [Polaromonas sp.]